MQKIVVLGSCSVDFITYASRLPSPGETVNGTKFVQGYGGKGANQCVAAAKLGASTAMLCRVGDDQWGHAYKEYLGSLGIDVSHVIITPNEQTGIAQIAVGGDGENQIIIVPGANNKLTPADVEASADLIRSADILIAQLETPPETTLAAFMMNNKIKIFNAAPAYDDIVEILENTTILCVNESEASILSNVNVNTTLKATKALRKLIQTGCQAVIITMGDQGAVYMIKDNMEPIYVLCDPVEAVDTTGAGDAFVGALATFITTHDEAPFHQQIGAACEVATFTVTREGTQASYPVGFDAFSRQYPYKTL